MARGFFARPDSNTELGEFWRLFIWKRVLHSEARLDKLQRFNYQRKEKLGLLLHKFIVFSSQLRLAS